MPEREDAQMRSQPKMVAAPSEQQDVRIGGDRHWAWKQKASLHYKRRIQEVLYWKRFYGSTTLCRNRRSLIDTGLSVKDIEVRATKSDPGMEKTGILQ